ncbi:hypothetical protein U14_02012 [Candidatus Moduliflexus flocculans]|uniref:Glycoside hydrolase family 127 protein n=1 Tax=Candidatus Moduliflexus flocculans TaxID=1499966 RepID=A0A0S6VYW0_9BACT|nr:hypothetical protein U14_02012 [Candidatus Moduliflexus flocculans]
MSQPSKATAVPLKNVKITDAFWSRYIRLVNEVVLPYQWEVLNDRIPDAEPSHAVKNFRIAAGDEKGEFYGFVFQDTDIAKWLETVAYSLTISPNPELERTADEMIDLIARAQQPDGYLNTYFIIKAPERRWTNLREEHELYTAGHFIEAAVAYFQATGKRKLLDVLCRFVDLIEATFGTEPGKLRGYPGHQEIELALVKLYRATGEERYLRLSQYFLNERGREPFYFDLEYEKRGKTEHWPGHKDLGRTYAQTHLPVREQTTAVGHAVRAVYMYSAMADVARETNDQSMFDACKRLWQNMTTRQMYITGGIGSTSHGEAFTFDYDLPNDTMYTETCASVGLMMFAQRMLLMEEDRRYADVMEQALYNNLLSGMSQDGTRYFYVNPLEVWPEASAKSPIKKHVKPVRQKWYVCACCPPNLARLLTSLGQYMYTVRGDALFVHLYIGGEATVNVAGHSIGITQQTNYPWNGNVKLSLKMEQACQATIGLRIPGWCRTATLAVNGENIALDGSVMPQGYAKVTRTWQDGDMIELNFDMPVEIMQAHPHVRANVGKVAIMRGPVVYCIEEVENGSNLSAICLSQKAKLTATFDENLFGGAVIITGEAKRLDETDWDDVLYRPVSTQFKPITLTAIPYGLWGNRASGEMAVWLRAFNE